MTLSHVKEHPWFCQNCCNSRSLTGIVRLLFPCGRLITDNSNARLLLNASIFESIKTLSVWGIPTPIAVQVDKYWLVRACESLWDTREILATPHRISSKWKNRSAKRTCVGFDILLFHSVGVLVLNVSKVVQVIRPSLESKGINLNRLSNWLSSIWPQMSCYWFCWRLFTDIKLTCARGFAGISKPVT